MGLEENLTHYDALDISSDASPQEIREAYFRAKTAYNKESVALYSLIGTEEREDALQRIEEAYAVLSNSERRREYDQMHGILGQAEAPTSADEDGALVVSIDRVPPMDSMSGGEDLLIPPTTEIAAPSSGEPPPFTGVQPRAAPPPFVPTAAAAPSAPAVPEPAPPYVAPARPASPMAALQGEIDAEKEWPGAFFRKIREAQRLSLEETAAASKITKNYILAIEEENFSKLPAPVFVRGFIVQLCRILKLPGERASAAYMARYQKLKGGG
ncbi:MAG: helix-turn-helix domain-containing protein [Bdellovibrionota bacterium]